MRKKLLRKKQTVLKREDSKMLKTKSKKPRKLPKLPIKNEIRKSKLMIDNKPETKRKKDNTKPLAKELTKNTKTDVKLSELLWMQLTKLNKIHRKQSTLPALLLSLITESQMTPLTKKNKLLKTLSKKKNKRRNKTKAQVNLSPPRRK